MVTKDISAQPTGRTAQRLYSAGQLLGGPAAALLTLVVLSSGLVPGYQMYTVGLAAVYGLIVLSISLLAGWTGIWSIGHPAMVAIGAYATAYGSSHGWGLAFTSVVAVVLCALLGGFLGFAGSRFSVLYVALLTLAFTLVILEIIGAWKSVTGGDQGVPVETFETALGDLVPSSDEVTYLAVGILGLAIAVSVFLRRTTIRMRMVAAKTHPLAGRSIGIAPELQSSLGFAISAGVAGLSGVLLALLSGFISPEGFSMVFAVNLIAATVLGGTGSVIGAVLGGAFLASAPTLASSLSIDQPYLIGGVLILTLLFLADGIVPTAGKLLRRFVPVTRALGRPAPSLSGPDLVDTAGSGANLRADAAEAAVLRTEALGVRFGGLQAVHDIDLRVGAGEVLAIIGPNGAGKTTFVNALCGLIGGGELEGTMELGGRPLNGVRATRRRSLGLGRTFQHAELFAELTVLENVSVVNRWERRADRDSALQVLASVGLADHVHRLPGELPFGLQKRVDLARAVAALADNPRLMVLDEPFGGLDADERRTLAEHIRRLSDSGTSVVIIDHVLDDLFAVADRVVAFDFGELIADGTPDTVLQNQTVRDSYLGNIDTTLIAPDIDRAATPLISVRGVEHHYAGVRALSGIDLDVHAGGILGIVGANGAGKSTLGRILHGDLHSTGGTRTVTGTDALRLSLVPEGRALFRTLSVRENLEVAAYAAGISGRRLRTRLEELQHGLPERVRTRMNIPAGSLSGGEQQLVAIARALMADPEVLILDEPALGLSPAMVDEVYSQVNALARRGITTILLDQSLARALESCSEIVVLRQGEVVARGNSGTPGFGQIAEAAYFGTEIPAHIGEVFVPKP
ncbi:branched-chain amino acid ABC transporter substrate-binding protein [Rhodococcus sp. ACS1]|uniref:branched-chain amino acid ABC transporter ATP-binding protein/permease n=1 Tax=Rhodococcus TaxID=1827 RepID=UPI000BB12928|nr:MULTISPECIES: ATP-binding cassette domain-containing protein [Rhodococcus]PBC46465.1 branched-chain amino acid ABC transporter substrate-binding protein [Rhodococcus sp. ACS1]QSE82432.1 ATP-binding cassette domain-containing protein [Rhodococcus koreensis]